MKGTLKKHKKDCWTPPFVMASWWIRVKSVQGNRKETDPSELKLKVSRRETVKYKRNRE